MIDLHARRLVIAYNPHSSRARLVQSQVFDRLDRAQISYTKIEVRQASLADNVARLRSEVEPNDVILCAAGDGSAHAMAHSVMAADRPGVQIGFLAFGNFNDLPHAFNNRDTLTDPVKFLQNASPRDAYPLTVAADGKILRHALLYITIGWTARAAAYFDRPVVRTKSIAGRTGLFDSLYKLGIYYFQSRKSSLLPEFTIAGRKHLASDILVANGPKIARLFRSGRNYYLGKQFLVRILDVRKLIANTPFLVSGLVYRIRGEVVDATEIDFGTAVPISLQCDGEVVAGEMQKIRVAKMNTALQILTTK